MNSKVSSPIQYVENIRNSGMTIYEAIEVGDPIYWIPTADLESLLNDSLKGKPLGALPLRTRSKAVKVMICEALGYPVPRVFSRRQPRFPGQALDTYIQKSNNLQIWNEALAPARRYAIIGLNNDGAITEVKVVTGQDLSRLDTTGTLTQKYQARLNLSKTTTELVSEQDTEVLKPFVQSTVKLSQASSPIAYPVADELLPIKVVFDRLSSLVGVSFSDRGADQERNRGAALHRLVCSSLGYQGYSDDGRFPDIKHQLLEVKLQTSPTIDLGLVCPNSVEALDIPKIGGIQIRHCDIRYALFAAQTDGITVTLTHFILSTGENFFSRFPQFQGKVLNKKLQIRLPKDFISR